MKCKKQFIKCDFECKSFLRIYKPTGLQNKIDREFGKKRVKQTCSFGGVAVPMPLSALSLSKPDESKSEQKSKMNEVLMDEHN